MSFFPPDTSANEQAAWNIRVREAVHFFLKTEQFVMAFKERRDHILERALMQNDRTLEGIVRFRLQQAGEKILAMSQLVGVVRGVMAREGQNSQAAVEAIDMIHDGMINFEETVTEQLEEALDSVEVEERRSQC